MLPCEISRAWVYYDYRPVPPPCCLWVMRLSCHHCRWVGPGLYWRAIISPWPWWAVGPFLSCLARCLVIQAGHVPWVLLSLPVPLGSPVEGLASFVGCDVLWGHHFRIIYNTVWIRPDLESLGIVQVNLRNPCALHLNAFELNIVHILLCYFGRNYIFRVWIRPLVHWTLPYLGFSHCISAVPEL